MCKNHYNHHGSPINHFEPQKLGQCQLDKLGYSMKLQMRRNTVISKYNKKLFTPISPCLGAGVTKGGKITASRLFEAKTLYICGHIIFYI